MSHYDNNLKFQFEDEKYQKSKSRWKIEIDEKIDSSSGLSLGELSVHLFTNWFDFEEVALGGVRRGVNAKTKG